jgi:hypothetical protein
MLIAAIDMVEAERGTKRMENSAKAKIKHFSHPHHKKIIGLCVLPLTVEV